MGVGTNAPFQTGQASAPVNLFDTTGSAPVSPVTASTPLASNTAAPASTKIAPTQGWYVFAGIIVGVSLSSTRAAPLVMGILSLALIYQVSALLMHTPPSTTAPSLSSLIKKP